VSHAQISEGLYDHVGLHPVVSLPHDSGTDRDNAARSQRVMASGPGSRADDVRKQVAHFFKERGLELSHEKTQITIRRGNCTWNHDWVGNWAKRWQVGVGSNTYGRNKRDDAWSVVNRCGSQRKTCISTIASGAAGAVLTQPATWSCCMLTVIGRSMSKND
jgi:hypothetical protein